MTIPETPLILFSGLAADASVFSPQKLTFPQLRVPQWVKPLPDETLSAYSERFANLIRPAERCVIGGASFGGILALEIARFLNPLCVVLIGSVREPGEMPLRIRSFSWFRGAISYVPLAPLQWSAGSICVAQRWMPHLAGVARQFRDADPDVVRWSVRQLLSWKKPPQITCPVYQIHGNRDFVFPISRTNPDAVVRGGGHVISLTHAQQVNAFLSECLLRKG
jgi:pimeloyl-ACP methyl ester carboxylesterase